MWTKTIKVLRWIGVGALWFAWAARAPAALFMVNSEPDAPDSNPGDGVAETSPGSGIVSLRAAIMEANALAGPDTIVLPMGATHQLDLGPADSSVGDVVEASGDLDIIDDLTILGNGSTLDAGHLDRAFYIEGADQNLVTVTIKNFNIINGFADPLATMGLGGGIYARAADLTLSNCSLSSNTTIEDGGAIAVSGLFPDTIAKLKLDHCHLTNNAANQGGGILAALADATLTQTLVTDNVAQLSSGNQGGGGILAAGDATTIIIDDQSLVGENMSALHGGGIALFSASLGLLQSSITGNRANQNGGGLYNSAISPGGFTVMTSGLTGNVADADADSAGDGGGIYSGGGSNAIVVSRIAGNEAQQGEGVFGAAGSLDATNNWWGCNGGPGFAGCDTADGSVNFDPWLVLTLTAMPDAILAARDTTLHARLTTNSSGQDTSALGTAPDGIPIAFGNPILGILRSAETQLSGGSALAIFTAGPMTGAGSASATVDQATVTALITIALAKVWVDFAYSGIEIGTFAQPFSTLARGVEAVFAGGQVKIKAGSSAETLLLNKAHRLKAFGGTATIGRGPGPRLIAP